MTAVIVRDPPLYGLVLMFGTVPLAGRADTAVIALNAWLYIFYLYDRKVPQRIETSTVFHEVCLAQCIPDLTI